MAAIDSSKISMSDNDDFVTIIARFWDVILRSDDVDDDSASQATKYGAFDEIGFANELHGMLGYDARSFTPSDLLNGMRGLDAPWDKLSWSVSQHVGSYLVLSQDCEKIGVVFGVANLCILSNCCKNGAFDWWTIKGSLEFLVELTDLAGSRLVVELLRKLF